MKTHIKGSLYIIASAFFFGTYGVWSKMMAGIFDDFFQGWTRSAIILVILLPIGIISKSFRRIKRNDLKWYALFAFPGSLVIPMFYYGFTHLSIGTATLTFYAALTITSYLLGFGFFHEKLTWSKTLSLLLGIGGLYVIYAQSIVINPSLALPLAVTMIAGLCGGIEVVFTKKLSDKYSPIQLTFFLFAVSFVFCLGIYLAIHSFQIIIPAEPVAWIGTVMHALASTAAFFLVILGYKYVEPSVGGIVGLLEIPFGILFGVLLFQERVLPSIVIGGILIMLAAALPNITVLTKVKE